MLHAPDHGTSSSSCSCSCPTCSAAPAHSSVDHPLARAFPITDRDPLTRDLERELVAPIGAEAELLEGRAWFDSPTPRELLAALRAGRYGDGITESELRAMDGDR